MTAMAFTSRQVLGDIWDGVQVLVILTRWFLRLAALLK